MLFRVSLLLLQLKLLNLVNCCVSFNERVNKRINEEINFCQKGEFFSPDDSKPQIATVRLRNRKFARCIFSSGRSFQRDRGAEWPRAFIGKSILRNARRRVDAGQKHGRVVTKDSRSCYVNSLIGERNLPSMAYVHTWFLWFVSVGIKTRTFARVSNGCEVCGRQLFTKILEQLCFLIFLKYRGKFENVCRRKVFNTSTITHFDS